MSTIWVLGGLIGVLIALYMVRPRLERRRLSAARFFQALPPAKQNVQLRLSNPLVSRPFYLQLLGLLLFLAALLSIYLPLAGAGKEQAIGLWLLIDTSGSMSTQQAGTTRLALAQTAALNVLATAQKAAQAANPRVGLCVKLSTFDLERHDWLTTPVPDLAEQKIVEQNIKALQPRALGTNVDLIRSLFDQLADQSTSTCPVTHLVVITDLPAPEWIGEAHALDNIWQDVGQPVDNIGFTELRASRNPLSGLVYGVNVVAQAYHAPPQNAHIEIIGPTGSTLVNQPLTWQGDGAWRTVLKPNGPGQYHLRLSPGGAYALDDEATIEIKDSATIHVDWQLPDKHLLEQLGWIQDAQTPQLRVAADERAAGTIPTLLVGDGYRKDGRQEIQDFYEASALLADLNFDVAETVGIKGISLPAGFTPVLRGVDGRVWLSQRSDPPTVYVPGLPTNLGDTLAAFSATAFFNGVRWLLQERTLPPLYTNTTPSDPEPSGNRLALHDGEGDTSRLPISYGALNDLQPRRVGARQAPIWPLLLTAAAALFLVERTLAAYGGPQWR